MASKPRLKKLAFDGETRAKPPFDCPRAMTPHCFCAVDMVMSEMRGQVSRDSASYARALSHISAAPSPGSRCPRRFSCA